MGQVTFNTDPFVHGLIKFLAIIGLIAVLIVGWGCVSDRTTVISAPSVTTPTVATISYPSVLTFTVLSTTTSNGRYQVTTTSGNILYFADYATWNSMYPQNAYTATLVGTDGVGYNVGTVVRISSYGSYNNRQVDYTRSGYYDSPNYASRSYPTYWYYKNSYYQCDNLVCDQVSHKQTDGETLTYGRPPRPLSNGAYIY